MSPVLESIKQNIHILIEAFDAVYKESEHYYVDWRAKLVGYRDSDVDEEWLINNNPFVKTNIDLFAQLEDIHAKGVIENEKNTASTLDALWFAARKSDWRRIRHPVGLWDSFEEEYFNSGGLYGYKYIFIFTDSYPKEISPITISDFSDGNDVVRVESRVIGKHDMLIDKNSSCEDCVKAIIGELLKNDISLMSYVPNHPLYTKWFGYPVFSELIQFDDPIDFFYHKELDFSKFVHGLFRVIT
jgi:hypothetical protein